MKVTMASTNHFQIKNGKLVPKQKTPEENVNYKYIPYTPINRPTEQDYFRATINQLKKENQELKKLLDQAHQDSSSIPTSGMSVSVQQQLRRLQEQLKVAKQKIELGESDMRKHKSQLSLKDKQLSDAKKQNTDLRMSVNNLAKELSQLKKRLTISQMEAGKIGRVLESFSGTIEKVARLESVLSENPQFSQKLSYKSYNGSDSNVQNDKYSEDDRYLTPRQKIHDLKPNINHKNRSAQQKQAGYRLHSQGPVHYQYKKNDITPDTWKVSQDQSSNSSAQQHMYHSYRVITDKNNVVQHQHVDPVAGSISSMFYRARK